MPSYQDWQSRTLAPTWLQGPWGTKLQTLLGWSKDIIAQSAKDAIKARFVQTAPSDALPYAGSDRALERYPVDTDDTYRARLLDPWVIWEFAGSTTRILDAFHEAGFPNVAIYNNSQTPPGETSWPPDGDTSNWSRFWVDLQPPYPFPTPDAVHWNDGHHFDRTWTWGSTATPQQVQLVRGIISKWRPGHEICAGIRIRINDGGTLVVLTWGARPSL